MPGELQAGILAVRALRVLEQMPSTQSRRVNRLLEVITFLTLTVSIHRGLLYKCIVQELLSHHWTIPVLQWYNMHISLTCDMCVAAWFMNGRILMNWYLKLVNIEWYALVENDACVLSRWYNTHIKVSILVLTICSNFPDFRKRPLPEQIDCCFQVS